MVNIKRIEKQKQNMVVKHDKRLKDETNFYTIEFRK